MDLKTDIYEKRYRAEFSHELDSEATIRAEIDRIREDMFNLPFEETSKEIIGRFKTNFDKLKQFMQRIDDKVDGLQIMNEKEAEFDDPSSKFAGIQSVAQLKHLLKNYDGLVDSQHALMTQSLSKMAKIPAPEDVSAAFSRFSVLRDNELEDMRTFLQEHKKIMGSQVREFENERQAFEEANQRMEHEKQRISSEREQVEGEVRKIKDLNRQLLDQMGLGKP